MVPTIRKNPKLGVFSIAGLASASIHVEYLLHFHGLSLPSSIFTEAFYSHQKAMAFIAQNKFTQRSWCALIDASDTYHNSINIFI